MKKFTGNYSSDAGKALKNAGGRLFCRIDEDGMIYTCTGYFVYRMRPDEYAATVQPVTKCDAGNWIIENGEKREAGPADFNPVKTFRETVNACTGAALDRCPADFTVKGGTLSSYYSPAGFAAFYNQLFTAPLYSGLTIRANSATAPAVFYDGEEAVAMVLPVRAKADAARAVKSYFTAEQADEDKPAETPAAELEALRTELEAARNASRAAELERAEMLNKITEQAAALSAAEQRYKELQHTAFEIECERNDLRRELDAPKTEQAAAEQPAPDTKTAAEIIAARFAALDGVTATIKGASTSAPVVWLDGVTEKTADAVQAAGAKWSSKRAAYYVRVA